MNIRFYRDPAIGEPHIYNHGVTEEEVGEVLRRPGEDRRGREGSRVAIAKRELGGFYGSSRCQTLNQKVYLSLQHMS